MDRLADALELLARRWRREAADPGVAWALKDRFGGAAVEIRRTQALVAGLLNTHVQAPETAARIAPEHLARLYRALESLAELATLNPRVDATPTMTIVNIETHGRVTRLEKAARKVLKDVARALAIGAIGASLLTAMPAAAATVVGDPVYNPVTGVTEEVVEVVSPVAVRTNLGNVIFLATTVGATFTDPETGETYTVTALTTNAGGFVISVTVKDSASVTSTLNVVTNSAADITAAETADPPGPDSPGGLFTFPTAVGDSNNYANANFAKSGGDGKDGYGVRVCIPYVGCATIAKKPSSGGNGQNGPAVSAVVGAAWGDIQTVSANLPGIVVSSIGGNGGQGGDAYGNIPAASGGVAGRGGDVTLTASVTTSTSGDNSHGIFAQSRAGVGGKGGTGYILSSGGSGGLPAQGGSVTVTNLGNIKTTGAAAFGILAQSLGGAAGGGGASYGIIGDGGGGSAGGNGGNVLVYHSGVILTTGEDSHGIMAQSIGGSGGNAGASGGIVTFGDKGAAGGVGGTATIVARSGSSTTTTGAGAFGLFAQSIGGGGGNGGRATGLVALGSGGGAGGSSGLARITIESGALVATSGAGSHAVFAQSVGGGGGNAGKTGGAVALGASGDAGGAGGAVEVTSAGVITTTGIEARGVFAQSVGGGGGSGQGTGGLFSMGGSGKAGGAGAGVTVVMQTGGSVSTQGDGADGVFAQSVGGGGGSGSTSGGVVALGGSGGGGGDGGIVSVTNDGMVRTTGNLARGLFAQSVGGGGGTGGRASGPLVSIGGSGDNGGVGGDVSVTNGGSLSTRGFDSHAIFAQSVGGGGGDGGGAGGWFAFGASGGGGGNGGAVTVTNNGSIVTFADGSGGVFAQSVGGGGGNGGNATSAGLFINLSLGGEGGKGSTGGAVRVINNGHVATGGNNASAIFAQSVGGGGGNGGFGSGGAAGVYGSVSIGVGGEGGAGGAGGFVHVTADGDLTTLGADSRAVFAQSVGGGGGNGGYSVSASLAVGDVGAVGGAVAVGGDGGLGGAGGRVLIDYTTGMSISTHGARSAGLFAQSVGGGGGNGGWSGAIAAGAGGGGGGAVGVSVGGNGGDGGAAGDVTVLTAGSIRTRGVDAAGLFAQSIGGGGGTGGFALTAALAGGGVGAGSGSVGVGGTGGKGGAAGEVIVTSAADIMTDGDRSAAIFAQAVGGGGGAGGWTGAVSAAGGGAGAGAVGVTIGGSAGDGGAGGKVTVNSHGNIVTRGVDAGGVFAQSVGGGGGTGGFSVAAAVAGGGVGAGSGSVGVGGSGGKGGAAREVLVNSTGDILTTGDRSNGVFAQSIGGGGGAGGWSGVLAAAGGGAGSGAVGVSVGGSAGGGGAGGKVTVTSAGMVTTEGEDARGVMAQSVGGGGGTGGFSLAVGLAGGGVGAGSGSVGVGGAGGDGGASGEVTVTSTGDFMTSGDRATAIFAQSVGGGGGAGGWSGALAAAGGGTGAGAVGVAIGGSAGGGGAGGKVTIGSHGQIVTQGVDAYGIFAQSVGGGGGVGGFSLGGAGAGGGTGAGSGAVGVGGSGGKGGASGEVAVTSTGDIYTTGDRSAAIFAQAVGGGGGAGGWTGVLALAGGGSGAGAVGVSVGGSAGDGGAGGKVVVASHGQIVTHGVDASGVFAQSVGGGGGTGGFSLAGAGAGGGSGAGSGSVGVGGSGGLGGDSGQVDVDSTGNILTTGDRSSGIFAQGVGGGGGAGGWTGALAVAGGGSGAGAIGVSVGGSGGHGGAGGKVVVASAGQIVTQGVDSHGVMAQSVGGGGGAGGFSLAGAGAGGGSGAGSGSVSIGGSGAGGGSADTVTVTVTGEIGTSGARSAGVFAQSVGGGGGNGGWSGALALAGGGRGAGAVGVSVGGSAGLGGDGKAVDLTSSARISTTGVDAAGLLAQSIGGGGGTGGFAISGSGGLGDSAGAVSFSIGGGGGAGGAAGVVHVDSTGFISTLGDRSYAIQAQSIGGGGGTGGFAGSVTAALAKKVGGAISIAVGGSGGVGGDAGDVFVTSLLGASTAGDAAHGLFAQSVGGGGGSGGFSISGALSTGDTAVGISAALGGSGGVGGDAGDVSVNAQGVTTTSGDRAYAVFAQSVGGGGGDGGFAGALSGGVSDKSSVALGMTLGGSGGAAGDAGDVSVFNYGDVGTAGADSYAVFAQSVGGGGGTGGMAMSAALGGAKSINLSVALGGSGGAGGAAGDVSVTSTGLVITHGAGATAIFAQSVGGGGGAGGAAGALAMSGSKSVNLAMNIGGRGGAGSVGGDVMVDNSGQIITHGESAYGVFAESVGGGGGHGGMAGIDETAWSEYMAGGSGAVSLGSGSQNISVAMGGFGGTGDDAGDVFVTNGGAITTFGAMSNVIYAQSIGGGGGDAGVATAASGSFGAGQNGTYAIAMGGNGGEAGDGGLVSVINTGSLLSMGDGSVGVFAQSVGGGGGAGGDARGFSLSFSKSASKKATSVNVSIGGQGGAAGDGGAVTVDNSGQIVTWGGQASGIFAQSVGGGGGRGGLISTQGEEIITFLDMANKGEAKGGQIAIGGSGSGGGDGGAVTVTNSGLVLTMGQGAHAVFAQSVGGGGGDGGSGLAGDVSVGGQGGVAGDGGDVTVRNSGIIVTQGDIARGIFAQSVGGGGGTGGATDYDGDDNYSYRQELSDTMSVVGNLTSAKDLIDSFSEPAWGIGIAGAGGSAGDGGNVLVVNTGAIFTSGDLSHGVFAQSVGGGGGTGGEGVITAVGQIVFSGAGGAAGDGGDVTVTNEGLIQTEGFGAYGIFAQSIGGGGGVAGDMSLGIASWGDLGVYGGEDYSSYGSFTVNPLDGYGGDGGDVTVNNTGDIIVLGEGAVGIFAQSVGGGGGLFGSSYGLAFAGSLGGWGDAGTVTVNQNGNVYVGGKNGTGAFFQSQAGDGYAARNIVVTLNGDVHGGSVYGKGVLVDGGNVNLITLLGTVSARSNLAIVATGGDDTINSYEGVIGNIDLGGGANAFNNFSSSVLQTLDYVLLNGTAAPRTSSSGGAIRALAVDPAAGLLTNEGVITPGGVGVVQVTLVAGSYKQTATGSFVTDLDLRRTDLSGEIDRLNVTGWADVQGRFDLNFLNPGYARPGDHTATIISAGGPLAASGLTLTAPTSAVATFALKTTDHELNLNYVIDFSPGGLTANRTAVGDYINAVQDAGSSANFSQVVAQLFFEPSQTALSNYYDSFSPETYGDQVAMAGFAVDRFADSMMTCPAAPGGESDRGCTWGRISNRSLTLDATAQDMAFEERSLGLSLGFEAVVAGNWRLGVAGSGEAVDSGVTGRTSGSGERYQLGVVVKRMAGPFTFAVAAGAGVSDLEASRYVILPLGQTIAKGDQSLSFQSITARASWRHGDDEFYLKPIVEVSGTSVSTDGFTETGAGPLNLVVPQQTTDSTRASFKLEVGGEISQGETVARPYARIGVSNMLSGSDTPFTAGFQGAPAGVNPFDVQSRLDKTTFDTEFGISGVGAWGSGRLSWSGQFGDRVSTQTFAVKVTVAF